MKKISTKAHGIIDYTTAAGLFALPRIFRWNPGVTKLLTGSAILTAIYSMLTRYELGIFKVLPMKTHLKLDAAQSASLATAPFFFVNASRPVTAWLLGLSIFEGLVALNSASRPKRKFMWFEY